MKRNNSFQNNSAWKGGRTLASNGYIKIKVGSDHHLAHANGYAYEHRLVAEQMLGRRLGKREKVHHRNKIKTDNRPRNLKVFDRQKSHMEAHHPLSIRRKLDEINPSIVCACGCRSRLLKYDKSGRPRLFIHGHNK